MIQFIARCKGGTERKTLPMAARRLHSVWMPWDLRSRRYGRGKTRGSEVQVRPLMPYLFCEGTGDQMRHLLDHRDVFGTVWFVTDRDRLSILEYRSRVERTFRQAMHDYADDEQEFHCQYKRGDKVLLQMGRDVVDATFQRMTEAGDYELEIPGISFAGKVKAHPRKVSVAL